MRRWWGVLRSLVIYNHPIRRLAWTKFYRSLLRPGDLAIDVGAHVGTRTVAMRAAGARVIAVEPQTWFARFLRRTLPRDVVVLEVALGRAETISEMAVSSKHPTVSSLKRDFVDTASTAHGFENVRWDASQQVQVITLDRLIERYGIPRYVKLDVEGFEADVLAGLQTPVELISIEYLPGFPHFTHAAIDRLDELGPYLFNPVVGEGARFLWPHWRKSSEAREWLDGLGPDESSGDLFASREPTD